MKILDASYLNSVLEIRNAYKPLPNSEDFGLLWSDAQILNSIEKQEVYGALDDTGELMAFLVAQNLDVGLYEIHLMMTHPEAVRRGFMEQLFQSWLQTCKYPWHIWLEVHEKNIPAIRFYEKQGFTVDSFRVQYYSDGAGAILYSLKCN